MRNYKTFFLTRALTGAVAGFLTGYAIGFIKNKTLVLCLYLILFTGLLIYSVALAKRLRKELKELQRLRKELDFYRHQMKGN